MVEPVQLSQRLRDQPDPAILGYCGIKTVGVSRLSEVRHRSEDVRARWIDQVRALGQHDAATVHRNLRSPSVAMPTG